MSYDSADLICLTVPRCTSTARSDGGTDAVKTIALGAKAVGLGAPNSIRERSVRRTRECEKSFVASERGLSKEMGNSGRDGVDVQNSCSP